MLMAKLTAEARYCLATGETPAHALTLLNERMGSLALDRFVTMVMAVLDVKSHDVVIVNAGHMNPIVRKTNGEVIEPGEDSKGPPIMVAPGIAYEQMSITLHKKIKEILKRVPM